MFGRKKTSSPNKGESLVSNNTTIEGNVFFQTLMSVYGSIKGHLTGENDQSQLIIAESGIVQGDIRAANVQVNGQINGTIVCRSIDIRHNARIMGNIYYEVLQIEVSSVINGQLIISDEFSARKKTANGVKATQQKTEKNHVANV